MERLKKKIPVQLCGHGRKQSFTFLMGQSNFSVRSNRSWWAQSLSWPGLIWLITSPIHKNILHFSISMEWFDYFGTRWFWIDGHYDLGSIINFRSKSLSLTARDSMKTWLIWLSFILRLSRALEKCAASFSQSFWCKATSEAVLFVFYTLTHTDQKRLIVFKTV